MASSCMDSSEGSSHNFCLKWSNYQTHVLSVLVQLLQSDTMVDVTLCTSGGHKVHAHRIVLCAASSYFQEILACSDDSHPIVILSEVSAEDIQSILEFVYHGELNVDANQLSSVLQVAVALQIKGLMEVSDQLPTLVPVVENQHQICEDGIMFPQDNCQVVSDTVSVGQQSNTLNTHGEAFKPETNEVNSFSCDTSTQTVIPKTSDAAVLPSQEIVYENILDNNAALPRATFQEKDLERNSESLKPVANECSDSSKDLLQFPINDKNKKRKGREHSRKDYSAEELRLALAELREGRMLSEAAAAHRIPRSTLYTRARGAGIALSVVRHEHSGQRVQAAVQAVSNGSSLQQASLLYQIPKTVLWRRVRAAGDREGWVPRKNLSYGLAHRQAAIQALQNGQNLSKVAAQFQIPKTTLFREKTRLVEAGKLPWSCLKKRDPQSYALKHSRIKEAVTACKEGKMSQAAASITYQVPKTTIWRRLKKGRTSFNESSKVTETSQALDRDSETTAPRLQEQVAFPFCENNTQIPVTYIVTDTDFPDSALII